VTDTARKATVLTLVLLLSSVTEAQSVAGSQSPENPFAELSGKTILVIVPHPDDDIIGCGGALAILSGRGNRVIALFLTAGENGSLDPTMTSEKVKKIRMEETAAAYARLGFPDAEMVWMGYPDAELDFAPRREIQIQLIRLIRARHPDVVFALDPGATYFRYHYRDHRSAALIAADSVGGAMWPLEYPEAGPAYRVPDTYYFYTAEPTLRLDITAVYQRKLAALAQHRSQFPPAVNHYTAAGPAPVESEMEALIKPLTGSMTTESFRRR
jgi:LmbE family N-acetylglucosaminyl deacetylase